MSCFSRCLLASVLVTSICSAAERPLVSQPRQTSGDHAVAPVWDETFTVTVGNRDADVVGHDQRAIQAAVDQVARFGGGTVHLLAGTYRLRNSIYLQSNVNLIGSGTETLLIKEPSCTTQLDLDSDWYDQEITLQDASGFRVGDGVCLRAVDATTGVQTVIKRTLVARSGNRFKLDRPLRQNLWRMNQATCATLFPVISGENIENVHVENLTLDGNREHNAELDGNYSGCIFLQDCNRITMRGVIARNNHGDGISWQICHDVVVENCTSENNTGLGLHPGSGSQRPIIRNNTLRGNNIGIFFCWGVKYGLAERNVIENNRVGISIGHRDTDNLITNNTVRTSQQHGILFRPERGADFAGHRNRIEANQFVDNGSAGGAVIDIQGGTTAITIQNNRFVDTRDKQAVVGVRQGPETQDIVLNENQFDGVAPSP